MPVAEAITIASLGFQAAKLLAEMRPNKALDRAERLQQESAQLMSEEVFQKYLQPEQRAELDNGQARIDCARQALPNTLTVKEILKKPQLVRKAAKYKEMCKEHHNRVLTISSHAKIADARIVPVNNTAADSAQLPFRRVLKSGVRELELNVRLPRDQQTVTVRMQLQEEVGEGLDATHVDTTNMTLDVSGIVEIEPNAARSGGRSPDITVCAKVRSVQIRDLTSNTQIVKEAFKITATVKLG